MWTLAKGVNLTWVVCCHTFGSGHTNNLLGILHCSLKLATKDSWSQPTKINQTNVNWFFFCFFLAKWENKEVWWLCTCTCMYISDGRSGTLGACTQGSQLRSWRWRRSTRWWASACTATSLSASPSTVSVLLLFPVGKLHPWTVEKHRNIYRAVGECP